MAAHIDCGKVLVVEDEFLVSLAVTSFLEDLGFAVAPLGARVSEACALAESEDLVLAILDINVAGEMSWPVARILKARRIPMLFLSGYSEANIQRPPELADVPICVKPLVEDDVRAVIDKLLGLDGVVPATHPAVPNFPD
jgi:DNA-binding response OmpR family regulator